MVLDSDLECFRLMDNLLPSSSDTLVDDLKPTFSSSSVSCPEQSCRTVTDDFHLIEQHYSTCHQHFCSLCGLSFISSRLLSVHEQIVHRGLFKPKMPEFRVHHWDELVDGQLTLENMLKMLKSEGCSCINYKFKPGTDFPEHTHDEDKVDCIVSGQLSFTMYGKEIILGPGDRLEVPRNVPHSARVIGQSPVVFVDATRKP
ncbi:cupin domain [Schistosoma japonicum]|uniref:Cupin domain n=2 Tax=Schistosoma japonicum TaxID=6182 RepID=A0A4Z2CX19_SCHJA|nr:cupin domain [Schistosoma japonicum]TNN08704.1 cupin domain [Schistosoma japonicum]